MVGGIVGGILGILLLMGIAGTFYFLARRKRARLPTPPNPAAEEKPDDSNTSQGRNLARDHVQNIDMGGRLHYLNHEVTEGGRFGSRPTTDIGGRLRYPNDDITEGGRVATKI
jgi:hypothetical protein